MKIYTKTGDKGQTSLFGGKRVPKDELRIEAYGTVDELNSLLGICRSMNPPGEISGILEKIQNELFILGADLATPGDSSRSSGRIQPTTVAGLEQHIDAVEPKLEPLKNFILPGGNPVASTLHFARTVCRRAERRTVQLAREQEIDELNVVYLNRLSDLLFVLARWSNAISKTHETKWSP